MVKLNLFIKAELDNVTDLEPTEDFEYFFKVKCTSCQEEHPNLVTVNRKEERQLTHGKGSSANFVWKCGNCKRESSASFDEKSTPQPYSIDANGQYDTPMATLDCRGLEFIGFDPKGIWKCKGAESSTVFAEVDLSEGEWTDYDEKAKESVGIMNIESEWSRASTISDTKSK